MAMATADLSDARGTALDSETRKGPVRKLDRGAGIKESRLPVVAL